MGLLYLVKQGDTLERIAEAVEAKPGDIIGYCPNHVAQDSDLVPGQQLLVPGATVQRREHCVTYDVRPGDTVGSIAGRFGLHPRVILAANELSDANLIYEGQALIIPPSSSVVAQIQPGDSLSSLAERWGVEPTTIANYLGNDISHPDKPIAGQPLIIPIQQTANAPAAADRASGTTTPENASQAAAATDGSAARASAGQDHQPGETARQLCHRRNRPRRHETEPPRQARAGGTGTKHPAPASASRVSTDRHSSAARPRGNFIWPAKGTISQHLGPTTVTIEPPYDGHPHFHNGLDITNHQGTPVIAADDGMVGYAGWSTNGLGYSVEIDHDNGLVTWYGHLAEPPSVSASGQGAVSWTDGKYRELGRPGRALHGRAQRHFPESYRLPSLSGPHLVLLPRCGGLRQKGLSSFRWS
jgi:murein DD-endopeptidase MepM/ murein hydrolase activator NlpD